MPFTADKSIPDNVQELANMRLTVDAFIQHLANSNVHLMTTQQGEFHLHHLSRKQLDKIKQDFFTAIMTQAMSEDFRVIVNPSVKAS